MLRAALLVLMIAPAYADEAGNVIIKTFAYGPKTIRVTAGTKVTWINKDPEVHTVVSKDGKFRSGALDTGDSFSFAFDRPGTYAYFCTLHPQMVGTVEVVPK